MSDAVKKFMAQLQQAYEEWKEGIEDMPDDDIDELNFDE